MDLDGNAHIDAAWLWPRSETVDAVRRTFTTALQLMNEYPNYVYTQSAAQYYEWMADKYPDLNDQIKQRIKEGRWEVVGGMWVEPDLNLPSGESQVRQLLVGQRFFKKEYGVTARIGWNPDSFGYNWQLPQIYKRSGLDYFVTQKMHWNDTNQLPFRLFWWESPDGSKVLTYFPTDYVHTDLNPTRISADFAESAARNPGTIEHLDLYGVGDHGGGPTRDMLDQGDHWIAEGAKPDTAVPHMRYSTVQHYFDDVQAHLNPDSPTWDYDSIAKGYTAPPAGPNGEVGIPTWKDELYFEFHRGIYTTQAAHKRNIRTTETATLNTEKLASLAWLDGDTYPDKQLNTNWQKITFNEFHDLAAGSGIAVIYRDAAKDFHQVFARRPRHRRSLPQNPRRPYRHPRPRRPPSSSTTPWPGPAPTPSTPPPAPRRRHQRQAPRRPRPPRPRAGPLQDAATHAFNVLARVNDVPHSATPSSTPHPQPTAAAPASDLTLDDAADAYTLANSHLKLAIDKQTGCITSIPSPTQQSSSPPTPAATSSRPTPTTPSSTTPGTSIPAPTTDHDPRHRARLHRCHRQRPAPQDHPHRAHLEQVPLHPGHLPRCRRRRRSRGEHRRMARDPRRPQSRLPPRRHQQQGDLRDPLRQHPAHHPPHQLLGEGPVRSPRPPLGRPRRCPAGLLSPQQLEVRLRRRRQSPSPHPAPLARLA